MNTKNKKRGKVVLSMMVLAAMIVTMMSTTLTAYAYNKPISSPDLDGYSASVTASQSGSTETFTCASKQRYPVAGDPNAKIEYLWEKNEHAGDWRYWYAVNGATTESHSVGITTTNSGGQHKYRCRVDAYSTAVYEYIDDAYVAILGRHGEKGGIDAWGNLLISHNQITHMRGTVVTNPENVLITNEVASMAAALFFSQEWLIDSRRAYDTGMKHGGFPLYQYDYRHMPFNEAFVRQCFLFMENSEHAGSGWEDAIYDGGGSQVIVQIPCNGQHVCVKMPSVMLRIIKEISESSSSNYRRNKLSYATPYDAPSAGQFDWGGDGVNVSTATALLRRRYSSEQQLPITYSVAFDGNGATSGSTAGISMIANVSRYLTNNGFARTGYTFAGWATSRSGNVAYYNQASVNNLTTENKATVTLYAKWTPIHYNIQFNGNGATGGSTAGMSMNYDDASRTLTPNGFTRTGYTFAGWATSNQGGVVYGDQAPVRNLTATNGTKINLYAKWTPIKYTINFEGNGNTGGSAPPKMPMAYDTAKNLPSNTFVRGGYTFAGWELDGKNYAAGTPVNNLTTKDGATVTFLAQWKANGYNIVFNGNGADSGSTAGMSMTYDDVPKALTKNGFTKDEYMFTGWARSAKGAVEFNDEQEVRNLGTSDTVTLYAQWRYTPQLSGTRYFMVPTYLGTEQHPQSKGIKDYDVWFTAKRSQNESFFAKHVLHADEKVVIKGKITVPVGGGDPTDPSKDKPEEIHTTIPQDPKK